MSVRVELDAHRVIARLTTRLTVETPMYECAYWVVKAKHAVVDPTNRPSLTDELIKFLTVYGWITKRGANNQDLDRVFASQYVQSGTFGAEAQGIENSVKGVGWVS